MLTFPQLQTIGQTQSIKFLSKIYAMLYILVHQALTAMWNNNAVSAIHRKFITKMEPIVGTFKGVHIIEVSTFQRAPQGRDPLYYQRLCLLHQQLSR